MTNVFLTFMQSFVIIFYCFSEHIKSSPEIWHLFIKPEHRGGKAKRQENGFGEHLGNVPKRGCVQRKLIRETSFKRIHETAAFIVL